AQPHPSSKHEFPPRCLRVGGFVMATQSGSTRRAAAPLTVVADPRPQLPLLGNDPAQTASDLVAVLAPTNALFRRDDHLVRIIAPRNGRRPSIMRASIANIVDFAHQLTRPVRRVKGD